MWKKALVIGFGKSGKGAAKLLRSNSIDVSVVDKDDIIEKHEDIRFFKETDSFDLSDIDVAVLSPGIAFSSPIVKRIAEKGINIIGEIELGLNFCKNKVLGVTGSNGKTTTVLLIEFILNEAKKSAKAVGNVGISFAHYLSEALPHDILILELSSYQLEAMHSKRLSCAAILNITPDHMDRYDNFDAYARAKCHIFDCLKEDGELFVNDDIYEKFFRGKRQVRKFNDIAGENILLKENSKIAKDNLIAAFAICKSLGVDENVFFSCCGRFKLPPHRMEFVAEVNEICFYNDSKATNVEAVLNALEKVSPPIILIMGGQDKRLSFEKLNYVCRERVKCVFAIGQCSGKIKEEISSVYVKIVNTMEEAVRAAYKEAKVKDNILLAPACASFDMFKNYEHRGEEFKRCVETIAIEEKAK
jgi:UDP-N-acetylmuramoylalanine--D-glutamate ligase